MLNGHKVVHQDTEDVDKALYKNAMETFKSDESKANDRFTNNVGYKPGKSHKETDSSIENNISFQEIDLGDIETLDLPEMDNIPDLEFQDNLDLDPNHAFQEAKKGNEATKEGELEKLKTHNEIQNKEKQELETEEQKSAGVDEKKQALPDLEIDEKKTELQNETQNFQAKNGGEKDQNQFDLSNEQLVHLESQFKNNLEESTRDLHESTRGLNESKIDLNELKKENQQLVHTKLKDLYLNKKTSFADYLAKQLRDESKDSEKILQILLDLHKQGKLKAKDPITGKLVKLTDEQFNEFFEVAKRYIDNAIEIRNLEKRIAELESKKEHEGPDVSLKYAPHLNGNGTIRYGDRPTIYIDEKNAKAFIKLIQLLVLGIILRSVEKFRENMKKIDQETLEKIDRIRKEEIKRQERNQEILKKEIYVKELQNSNLKMENMQKFLKNVLQMINPRNLLTQKKYSYKQIFKTPSIIS